MSSRIRFWVVRSPATRARMFISFRSGVREFRSRILSMSSRTSKPSTIFTAGKSGASPNRSCAPTTKLPGTGLPTSLSCMTMPDHTTISPSQKIGIARIPSFACSAPHHGSFVKNMSPSAIFSRGHSASTWRTNSSMVDP